MIVTWIVSFSVQVGDGAAVSVSRSTASC
jgi:hypothetical protein